ncbi:MAG: class I SAM-dependent methyltransferase [Candidatus Hodarchaeota archaeon]
MNENYQCFDWASSFYDFTRAVPTALLVQSFSVIKSRIQLKSDSRLLEVGIGTGRISIPLAEELHDVNLEIVGIDISEKMLVKCRKKLSSNRNVSLICADGFFLPFSEKFEVILTSHILHLVSDPFKFVIGLLRILNGYYIDLEIYVNYFSTLPFQIYYNKLREVGYQHKFQSDQIRKKLTIFLHKNGWKHTSRVITSETEIQTKYLVRFLSDRVFRHQRKIHDNLHFNALKYLYHEMERQEIDLTATITVPAISKLVFFYQ